MNDSITASDFSATDYTKTMLNILEDFAEEKMHLEETQRASINILEDFAEEKRHLEETQRASINILEDFATEKTRLEDTQHATINILDDFGTEKTRLEETQSAMLNILEDNYMERKKLDIANRELKINEERLQLALDEKENLLKEIHHRVKNNLYIIYSMLKLQMSYIHDKKAAELFKDSSDRVYTMALIHEKLYQSEFLTKLDLIEYIHSLVNNLFISYGISHEIIRPKIDVENITLDIDTLIPCALIITELVSNSLKHAFPVLPNTPSIGARGEILIELRSDNENIKIRIRDNGIGIPKDFDMQSSKTLGLKLVYVLVKQLRGTITYKIDKGTEFTIIFNLEKRG